MASSKKKNYWYVIVMANDGPAFVTKVNYGNKTAQWEKDKAPIEFGMEQAKDLAVGLTLNFHTAFAVCAGYEVTNQPFRYEAGHFEWKWNENDAKEVVEDE